MSKCKNFCYLECPDQEQCEGDYCAYSPHDLVRCREYRRLCTEDEKWLLLQRWIWVSTNENIKWFCKECYKKLRKCPLKKKKIEK